MRERIPNFQNNHIWDPLTRVLKTRELKGLIMLFLGVVLPISEEEKKEPCFKYLESTLFLPVTCQKLVPAEIILRQVWLLRPVKN